MNFQLHLIENSYQLHKNFRLLTEKKLYNNNN